MKKHGFFSGHYETGLINFSVMGTWLYYDVDSMLNREIIHIQYYKVEETKGFDNKPPLIEDLWMTKPQDKWVIGVLNNNVFSEKWGAFEEWLKRQVLNSSAKMQ